MFVSVLLPENNEENIAIVHSREEKYLIVSYLSFFKKTYKGTKIFSFEKESEYVTLDQIVREYTSLEELKFEKIGENMYVEKECIDEESSSEIEDDHDDSEEYDYDTDDSFVVPDDEEVLQKPSDHKEVDAKWKEWNPVTSGAKRFKEKIDQIEKYMNHQIDEKYVFRN